MDFIKTGNGMLAPQAYLKLSEKEKADICNGMGPKGWGWLVPNHFFGADMTEAGNVHDYCYHVGGDGWAKIVSDLVFLFNMLRLIWLTSRAKRYRRYFMATRYFLAVFWGGKKSFNRVATS